MGRPGKLKLRTAVKGSGGQISLNNFTAEIIAKDLANKLKKQEYKIKKSKEQIFDSFGHVTLESISKRREFFLGKSVARIAYELKKNGYTVKRKHSNHANSKAKLILILNPSKERNIAQIQISPGSKRHGDVHYIKISTKDIGIIKIIDSTEKEYKTDGKEKATLLYRRYFK